MATTTETSAETGDVSGSGANRAVVDPRAPRFGQTLTTLGLAAAIVLDSHSLIYLVTAVLVAAVVSGWRLDLYGALWRHIVRPLAADDGDRESASPHRFARVLGAVGTTLASILLLVDAPLAGYVIAGAVAALAGLAAVTGICVGCRLYRQVQFFQRLGIV